MLTVIISMIITIDTKKDAKDDIQKAIELLQKYVQVSGNYGQDPYSTLDSSEQPILGSMFDQPETPESPEEKEEKEKKPFSVNELMTY